MWIRVQMLLEGSCEDSVTGHMFDHPPFEPAMLRAGDRPPDRADIGSRYVAPRMVELTRSSAAAICGEAGCGGDAPQRRQS